MRATVLSCSVLARASAPVDNPLKIPACSRHIEQLDQPATIDKGPDPVGRAKYREPSAPDAGCHAQRPGLATRTGPWTARMTEPIIAKGLNSASVDNPRNLTGVGRSW